VGGSKQEIVQALERSGALDSRCPESLDPGARFEVDLPRRQARGALRSLRCHRQERIAAFVGRFGDAARVEADPDRDGHA
jgi:hypothetical protein